MLISSIICVILFGSVASAQEHRVTTPQKIEVNNFFKNTKDELQQYLLYTAFAHFANNQSSLCYKEIQLIRSGYLKRKPWAMKVIDSTGIRPPGFLLGNNLWLGSRDTCNAAKYPIHLVMSDQIQRSMEFGILNETAPFDVHFKVAYLDFKSPWQVDWQFYPPEETIIWGICLPASCSNKKVLNLMNIYIKSDLFIEQKVLGIDATVTDVKDLRLGNDFFKYTSVKILIGYLSLIFIIIVIEMGLRLRNMPRRMQCGNGEFNSKHQHYLNRSNLLLEFFKCFDVEYNFKKIWFKNKTENAEINAICAIRSMNAYFIVFLHASFHSLFACVNRTTIISLYGKPSAGFLFISVDAFFILSGFLLTYNVLRNQTQRQLIRDAKFYQMSVICLKKFLHRWLRLAPLYFFIVCLNTVLHALTFKISIHKLPFREDILITDSWWRYLLFVQNFLRSEVLAVGWTWSTACEMQFFLVGTILLFIYVRRPYIGGLLFSAVMSGSIATYFHKGIISNFSWHYDVMFNSSSEIYFHSSVRILSYLMGMLAAWYVVDRRCSLHPILENALSNLSLAVFVILILLCDNLTTTPVMSISTLLLLRLATSLWICSLVVAAVSNRRTWLSPILEVKIFQPISRLSYCIYLINPIVIITLASLTDRGIHFDWTNIIIWTAGIIFLTTALAVIFSVVFELPYINLSELCLKTRKIKEP